MASRNLIAAVAGVRVACLCAEKRETRPVRQQSSSASCTPLFKDGVFCFRCLTEPWKAAGGSPQSLREPMPAGSDSCGWSEGAGQGPLVPEGQGGE
jgi:hypothetical protein